ncbi:MAG: PfkB family carbohydrate kinase [Pseudomonadota bacterium]
MSRLLQLSGAVVDLVYRVEALPDPGGEAPASAFAALPGGGFNAMVAARRAGLAVSYGGGLGSGPFAALVRNGLETEGIPPLRPADPDADQGSCVVLVDPSGERSFVSWPGAENHADPGELARLPAAAWTLLSGYALCGRDRAALARYAADLPRSTRLVFDPAPMVAEIPPAVLYPVLARTDWISANLAEARTITRAEEPGAAARSLLRLCAHAEGAVLRAGALGCWLAQGRGAGREPAVIHIPAFAVQPIDTNGAGDTHIGAFIAALAGGATAPEAARFANAAAALSTTRQGPATAPDLSQIREFLASTPTRQTA